MAGSPGSPGYPGYPGYPAEPGAFGSAMWAHLAALLTVTVGNIVCCLGILLGWVAPLTLRGQHQRDLFVRHHASQAVNSGITQAIAVVVYIALLIGASLSVGDGAGDYPVRVMVVVGLGVVYAVASLTFAVLGARKAKRGELWSYPALFALPFTRG